MVVINTCGFIDNAKQESIDTILNYARAKDEGLVEKVYVTGCLSQRYAPELKDGIPQVDAWFGTRDLPRLPVQGAAGSPSRARNDGDAIHRAAHAAGSRRSLALDAAGPPAGPDRR